MARNIEIKARIADLEALARRVGLLSTAGPARIAQDDTFFACPNGRLKLRDFGDGHGELIFYQRVDQTGPKTSFYAITPTAEPDSLREVLTRAHGQTGRVIKQRTLYLVERTRVHLDQVEGLGTFMELEVVLHEGEPAEAGEQEAQALMAALDIPASALIDSAYVDLLRTAAHSSRSHRAHATLLSQIEYRAPPP
ncbi:class IV adenylate cyclase [Sphaerotilus sp.]|uniref:class IV adenylate cyclase n=1 Tax=Sphaerotilus sp. TaxID=2093942 RepID=UPI0034E2AC0F